MQSNLACEEKSIKFSVIGLTVHSKVEQQSILKMKNEAKGHLAPLICTERRRDPDITATYEREPLNSMMSLLSQC